MSVGTGFPTAKTLCRRAGPGERVTRVLQRLCELRAVPTIIRSDNGPEFRGRVLDQWAYGCGVWLQFIEPGKPIQECFHRII